MKREVHSQLLAALAQPFGAPVDMDSISRRFPEVQLETLISIYCQDNQSKVMRSNHLHKKMVQEYCSRYMGGEDILDICAAADFPPCMMMRRMLERLLPVSKQGIGAILRDPGLLPAAVHGPQPQSSELLQRPDLLQRLQRDIQRCVWSDACYSPLSDLAKQAAGLEYELLLAERLTALGISFYTEHDLRAQGYFKTPDVWLHVPIAVRDKAKGAWRTVSWIDSKATFGDDAVHSRQMEEQYSTYIHRYGAGLVIYWFGYLDDLAAQDTNVMVLEAFPDAADVATLGQQ